MKISTTIFIVAFSLPLFSCKSRKSSSSTSVPVTMAPTVEANYILAKKDAMLPVGSEIARETKETLNDCTFLIKAQGQEVQGALTIDTVHTEKLTILSSTQMRLHINPNSGTAKLVANGQELNAPKIKSLPLDSLNVLLEKVDGKWVASLESGATPSEAQKKALEKQAANLNSEDELLLYGDAARQPGDKWQVDISTLQSFDEFLAGTAKGNIEMEFVEITTFEGGECALIKSTVSASGKTRYGKASIDATLKATNTTYRSIDDLIDLQTTIERDSEIKVPAGENGELACKVKNLSVTKVSIKKS